MDRQIAKAFADVLDKLEAGAGAMTLSVAASVSTFRRSLAALSKEIPSAGHASNIGKISPANEAEEWKNKLGHDVDLLNTLQNSPMLLFCDREPIDGIQALKRARQVVGVFQAMGTYRSGVRRPWDAYDYGLDDSSESWKTEREEGLNKHWDRFMRLCHEKTIHFTQMLKDRVVGMPET